VQHALAQATGRDLRGLCPPAMRGEIRALAVVDDAQTLDLALEGFVVDGETLAGRAVLRTYAEFMQEVPSSRQMGGRSSRTAPWGRAGRSTTRGAGRAQRC